ncbi:hypothetical protein [Natronosalvus rutilus]|uniref:Uncharacterized protein n=1 Tax=Natronosalvus rutilus TaxID=2953753 RepID=A0A9E7NFC2_9EURY|nr:hypothetical protein [Natronosalvus rutilus]UTF55988.1 hypothetical protein NGM29_21075 [Natronosalvus rutilus]
MAWTVLEARANATAGGDSDRVYPSIEAAIEDFEATEAPDSIDQIDTVKTSSDRVSIQIVYTPGA